MTFREFTDKDKRLFYSIKCCEQVIDDPETNTATKVIALAERVRLTRERDELYRVRDYEYLLKAGEDEDDD